MNVYHIHHIIGYNPAIFDIILQDYTSQAELVEQLNRISEEYKDIAMRCTTVISAVHHSPVHEYMIT